MSFKLPKFTPPDFSQDFLANAPDCKIEEVIKEGVTHKDYHALSIYPEYFKIKGQWVIANESRMDSVAIVTPDDDIDVVEFRNLKAHDKVVVGRTEDGSEGIYMYTKGFATDDADVDTFDLEKAIFKTVSGQENFESRENAHYNYIATINESRRAGSLEDLINSGIVKDGILKACVENDVPVVLAGSIRDKYALPNVYDNVYESKDAMRKHTRKATMLICLSSVLHTIASGNMTPSYTIKNGVVRPVYIYSIDIQEFSVNKLSDRGTLEVKTLVTNVQDFIVNVAEGLIK